MSGTWVTGGGPGAVLEGSVIATAVAIALSELVFHAHGYKTGTRFTVDGRWETERASDRSVGVGPRR